MPRATSLLSLVAMRGADTVSPVSPASIAVTRSFARRIRSLLSSGPVWKAIALAAFAAWPVVGNAGSVVCWSSRFAGLHEVSNRAEATIGGTTHDLSRVAVYFEKVDGFYFYQSNYLPTGERTPAKITSTEPMSVTEVLANVLMRRLPGTRVDDNALAVARMHLTIYSGTKSVPAVTDQAADRIEAPLLVAMR